MLYDQILSVLVSAVLVELWVIVVLERRLIMTSRSRRAVVKRLRYDLGIAMVAGPDARLTQEAVLTMVKAGQRLPYVRFQPFATQTSGQPYVQAMFCQKRPDGMSEVARMVVPVAPGPEQTEAARITIRVDEARIMTVSIESSTGQSFNLERIRVE